MALGLLDTDQVAGTTPGKIDGGPFRVTHDGAATYSLPLWVPPGRLGIQPEVGLRYHSRAENGLVGVGWALTGFSRISRTPKNTAFDSVEQPIQFDDDDALALDGERLVLMSGKPGEEGAVYRTRHDSFVKVVVHADSSGDSGPLWFEAFHRDGRIFAYGSPEPKASARIEGIARTLVPRFALDSDASTSTINENIGMLERPVKQAWLLQSITDRAANALLIEYETKIEEGGYEVLPTRILYTGHPEPGVAALRSVELDWEERPDPELDYVSGLKLRTAHRLRSVRMIGPNPTETEPDAVSLLREYRLTYQVNVISRRSLLTRIEELDGKDVALGAHVFDWDCGGNTFEVLDTSFSDIRTIPGPFGFPSRLRIADFDGDGREDILYVPRGEDPSTAGFLHILLADGSTNGFAPPYVTPIPVPTSKEQRVHIFPDPTSDHVNIAVQDVVPGYEATALIGLKIYRAGRDASGKFEVVLWKTVFDASAEKQNESSIEFVDLDGDGLMDFLAFENPGGISRWQVARGRLVNGELDFEARPFESHALSYLFLHRDSTNATSIMVNDFEATGGDPRFTALTVRRNGDDEWVWQRALTTLERNVPYLFGDFTGGGNTSAFARRDVTTSIPTLALNTGGTFGPATAIGTIPIAPATALRITDWRQDGRSSLLARAFTEFQEGPVHVLTWAGAGFAAKQLDIESTWLKHEDFEIFETIDFTGNGTDDIVLHTGFNLRVLMRTGKKADLMTRVTDGFGARSSVVYDTIANPAVHTRSWGHVYPQRSVTSKLWVVSELHDDDGIGGVRTRTYRYEGGVRDVTGAGFLGFQARICVEKETGIETRTTYEPHHHIGHGAYPFAGLPITETLRIPLGGGVLRVVTTTTEYVVRPHPSSEPWFVIPKKIVEETTETSGGVATMAPVRRTVTQDFDAFGNLSERTEKWDDGNENRTSRKYEVRELDWLLTLCSRMEQTSIAPNQPPQTRVVAYEYDERGLLHREILDPGPLSSNGYLPLDPQPDGVKTLYRTLGRDVTGQVSRVVEEESLEATGEKRRTVFIYDDVEKLFVVEVHNALDHVTKRQVHPGIGKATLVEDPNGGRVVRGFDGFGRLKTERRSGGMESTLTYRRVGLRLQLRVSGTDGASTSVDCDALGRPVRVTDDARTDGQLVIVEMQYDQLGRLTAQSRPRFAISTAPQVWDHRTYDALGRVTSYATHDGKLSRARHRGKWTVLTDASFHRTAMLHDDLGRVILTTDRDAKYAGSDQPVEGTRFEFGPFGHVARLTDIAGNATSSLCDRRGRAIETEEGPSSTSSSEYNAFGEVSRITRVTSGQSTSYHYDKLGRLTLGLDNVEGELRVGWDTAPNGVGRLAIVGAPHDVTRQFAYDAGGRVRAQRWDFGNRRYTMEWSYDDAGRVQTCTYPRIQDLPPLVLHYDYGPRGDLERVRGGPDNHVVWRRHDADASGGFRAHRLGNGLIDRESEDPDRPGSLHLITTTTPDEHRLREVSYAFDANRNLEDRADHILGTSDHFAYDDRDRLQRWHWASTSNKRTVEWSYDDLGNPLSVTPTLGSGTPIELAYEPQEAGPHAVVRSSLGQYRYDDRGNQREAPGRVVEFGRFDLPRSITHEASRANIEIIYDGLGMRFRIIDRATKSETDTIRGLYETRRQTTDDRSDHIFTVQIDGRLIARQHLQVEAGRIVDQRWQYLHTNHQGSVDLVTDEGGAVLERPQYDPHGRRVAADDPAVVTDPAGTLVPVPGYTGHQHLEEVGLIDMGGRFYDPAVGRFLSPDPFVPHPLNPQSWNRYSYVRNNPMTLVDPSGFFDGDEHDGYGTAPHRYLSVVRAPARPSPPPPPTPAPAPSAASHASGALVAGRHPLTRHMHREAPRNDDGRTNATAPVHKPWEYTPEKRKDDDEAVARYRNELRKATTFGSRVRENYELLTTARKHVILPLELDLHWFRIPLWHVTVGDLLPISPLLIWDVHLFRGASRPLPGLKSVVLELLKGNLRGAAGRGGVVVARGLLLKAIFQAGVLDGVALLTYVEDAMVGMDEDYVEEAQTTADEYWAVPTRPSDQPPQTGWWRVFTSKP